MLKFSAYQFLNMETHSENSLANSARDEKLHFISSLIGFGTVFLRIHAFFILAHFYKQRQVEIGKKSSKSKQHPETELLLFKSIHILLPRYHPEITGHCRKK